MPVYEYRCTECGHTFDALQRVGEDGRHLNCPKCQAGHPEKLFSAFASSGGSEASFGGGSAGGGCGPSGFG